MDSNSAQYAGEDSFCFSHPSRTMGGGGTMGRKGSGGRRMAVVAMVLLTALGVSGPRQRAASAARLFALLLAVAPGLCSAQLTFLPIKSVTMGPCNKSAIIPCIVTNLQLNNTKSMFVKWLLDDKEFFSYDGLDAKVVKNATFQTAQLLNVHKLSEGIASLTLARNETIGGNYVCYVVESNREGESRLELKYIYDQVSAVEVYTPRELSVENGTEATLSCTFTTSEVISSAAAVTWSFQAEGSTTAVSFFYYSNGKAYPGKDVPFKDRISWAGDLNKKDASINIANMQFLDNGTYTCDVKNSPDIVVVPGEIKLRVVESGRLRVLERVQVSGVVVYTPLELSVENGTPAKLPCTFASSEVISSVTSVTWSFQVEESTTALVFLYYINGKAYPGKDVPFKDRISWAGDLNKKDASISIANMQFLDNGTYICYVMNPPDIVVVPGEIKLRVVESGRLRVLERVQVSGVVVYTPLELSVENGTEATLPCTFTSSEVISSATAVTWSFQAEGSTTAVSFFYYSNGKAYPGKGVPFKGRISWAGDLNRKDASIKIANMRFLDNGTYTCDVKNPPDIVVVPGEIKLRVVER